MGWFELELCKLGEPGSLCFFQTYVFSKFMFFFKNHFSKFAKTSKNEGFSKLAKNVLVGPQTPFRPMVSVIYTAHGETAGKYCV